MTYANQFTKYMYAGDVLEHAQIMDKLEPNKVHPNHVTSTRVFIDTLFTHYYRVCTPVATIATAAIADNVQSKVLAILLGTYLTAKEYFTFKRAEHINQALKSISVIPKTAHQCIRVSTAKNNPLESRV